MVGVGPEFDALSVAAPGAKLLATVDGKQKKLYRR